MVITESDASREVMDGQKMRCNEDSRAVISDTVYIPDLSGVSVCMWMKCTLTRDWAVVSYAVDKFLRDEDNEILLIGKPNSKIELLIKGSSTDFHDHQLTDGDWHHLCMTWRSSDGKWTLTDDANTFVTRSGLETGETIKGGGSFIIARIRIPLAVHLRETIFCREISSYNIWNMPSI
ncbi:neuronal pentraxin-2-like [Saccoglossus kowalevskii]